MRPRPLCGKLNEFLVAGLENEIFLAIQTHLLQGANRSQSLGPPLSPGMISAGGISIEEFLAILDENRYSAVFADGALLIIQCTFSDNELDTHRYSYIPCPMDPSLGLIARRGRGRGDNTKTDIRRVIAPVQEWCKEPSTTFIKHRPKAGPAPSAIFFKTWLPGSETLLVRTG